MNSLFKIKEFLTLEEASNFLTKELKENVEISDLYQLIINGKLTLSLRFSKKKSAKQGKYIINETKDDDTCYLYDERNNKYFYLDDDIYEIDGVWDLLMLKNSIECIESLYQKEISGSVMKDNNDYFYNHFNESVSLIRDGLISQLKIYPRCFEKDYVILNFSEKELNNYYPYKLMIDDFCSQLVIKTSEIERLIHSVNMSLNLSHNDKKPFSGKEKNSLIILITALLQHSKIDPKQRGISVAIQKMIEKTGNSMSEDTIRKILKQVQSSEN